MMTSYMLEDLLNKKKKPLTQSIQKHGKWITWLTDFKQYKGIGNSEKEALENLSKLLDDVIKKTK
jgi:ADP-ribosylglycohydrolase